MNHQSQLTSIKNNKTCIYLNNEDNTARYALGEVGEKMLACIGLNPSTAAPNALDNTLRSVVRIAQHNGYDGWLMFNLYPLRATDPFALPSVADPPLNALNLHTIKHLLAEYDINDIWLAFGNLIESREFLMEGLIELYASMTKENLNWKIANEPTQKGHPRHPLYLSTSTTLNTFDMASYLRLIS